MKGLKRILSLCLILAMVIGTGAFSFADSAPSWRLGREYDEGDYVKFRGTIYMVIEEHISSTETYPGNPEYWAKYKKGAGFKKDDAPTLDKLPEYKDKDRDDKDDWKKDFEDLEPVYVEEEVEVYFILKEFDEDEYESKVYIYNDSDLPLEDWSLEFKLNEGEALEDVDDADYSMDDLTVTITPEEDEEEIGVGKKSGFELEVDTDDLYDDKSDVVIPYDFDLELTFGEAEDEEDDDAVVDPEDLGIVIVQLETPDFDEDIFEPEVKIGGEERLLDWGEDEVYEDLIIGKTYKIYAKTYKIDGMLYEPELSSETVKVARDEVKIITVEYEATELEEETGRVMVYVFRPQFDDELFTPEVTLEGETQEIDWGTYEYFDDVTVGTLEDFSAEIIEIDDKTYVPEFNTDEVKVKEDKVSYLLLRYNEEE